MDKKLNKLLSAYLTDYKNASAVIDETVDSPGSRLASYMRTLPDKVLPRHVYVTYRGTNLTLEQYADAFGLNVFYVYAFYMCRGFGHASAPIEAIQRPVMPVGNVKYDEVETVIHYGIPMELVTPFIDEPYYYNLLYHYTYIDAYRYLDKDSVKKAAEIHSGKKKVAVKVDGKAMLRFTNNLKASIFSYFKEKYLAESKFADAMERYKELIKELNYV
jgi:hypothetical protein